MPESPSCIELDVEVRYAETDQMGVVHHANYVIWFELARTRLCSLSGFHYADIERLASRKLRFAYEARNGAVKLVTGATEHVWIERATGRPCRIPEALREPFQRLADGVQQETKGVAGPANAP